MLLINKYRVVAAKGLILVLIAVFPANIYLAQSSLAQSLLGITQETAIIRLPFQYYLYYLLIGSQKNKYS